MKDKSLLERLRELKKLFDEINKGLDNLIKTSDEILEED